MTQQRNRSLSQFWGRFEQLEARTVLSAASSSAAYEVLDNNADFLETAPQFDSVGSQSAGHFESPAFSRDDRYERPDRLFTDEYSPQNLIDHYFVVFVSYRPPQFALSSEPVTPTEQTNTTVPPPLAAQAPRDDNVFTPDPRVESALAPLTNTHWFTSPRAVESTSMITAVAEANHINSHDVAFQAYWSEAALPAVVSDRQDADFDVFAELSDLDEDAELENDPSPLAEGAAKSLLEVLNLELAAIDSVLSQLHEFKFQHRKEAAADEARQHSNDHSPQADVAQLLPTEQTPADEQVGDLSAGGMVLLEADGVLDETTNIAAVFAQAMDRAGTEPLGVEISAGIYQAFEVGTSSATRTSPVASKVVPGRSDQEESQTLVPQQRS